MKRSIAAVIVTILAAGAAQAEGGKPAKGWTGHGGGVIRAECSVEVFASVNSLDRPTEGFIQQIQASIGPRATRADAYMLGEAYCRHPERLKRNGIAERALQDDIVGMRRR
ncbi:hypothetical protein [Gemmobacter sp.]|uniref:hypothetical protein n=1 Tax=Gemmobacter sp. TaxID=1898957 RepID=UPI002AFE8263|nr:hypothetical protein [Gemmobacter sp.]